MTQGYIGQSLTRLEDARFLTGKGQYIDDLSFPDCMHAVFVRSEYAHAELQRVDTSAASAMPGVLGVVSNADLLADGIAALPCPASFPTVSPLVVPPRYALAHARVRHVGDPIVAVVAKTYAQALAAAELVEIDYAALATSVDTASALNDPDNTIWPEAPGNLAFHYENGERGAVDAAIAAATHVVDLELVNNRVSAAPMETRAGVGVFDAATGEFTLHCNGQGVHGIRNQMAGPVFGLPNEQVRVVAPDVGGGFGLKNFLYPEWVVLLWAARRFAKPVRWSASRSEDFVSAAYGRDMVMRATLALDEVGQMLALRLDATANMGAYLSGSGPNISARAMPTAMGGIYAIANIYMQARGVFTNTVPVDAYRGAGKPEANYLIERLLDVAALRHGFDPIALRRQNAIETFPHRTALGQVIDGGKFGLNIDAARVHADVAGFAQRKAQTAKRGRLRGLGVGCFLETSRGTPEEGAQLCFTEDGAVEIRVGTESQGQGHETAYAQIAADQFGLPIDSFRYVQADTSLTRMGHGHGGARTMHMGGKALTMAIELVLERARAQAAQFLQTDASSLSYRNGVFVGNAGEASVSLMEVASSVRTRDGNADAINAFASHHDTPIAFPNGCHIAEVEVDPETGAFELASYCITDDYGNLINPMLTQGQVVGGVAQGIGQATGELAVHEPSSGQLLSASFMDYQIPRARELPDFDVHLDGTPTSANPLGVKGSGQAGCIGAPQTIVNAVVNALAPLGIEHIDMPLTPANVWRAVQAKQR
jgi:aerobic carbon-monoxide dehydrogenase large subunit